MAKRFTDTEKWKKPWFRALPIEAKAAWFYLLDDCDNKGLWPASFDRMSFDLKIEITEDLFLSWFKEKVIKIDEDKFLILSFIEFQYGSIEDLNPSNNAHKPIISLLKDLEKKGLIRGSGGAQDKDKDKDKEESKKSVFNATANFQERYAPDFQEFQNGLKQLGNNVEISFRYRISEIRKRFGDYQAFKSWAESIINSKKFTALPDEDERQRYFSGALAKALDEVKTA